MHCWQNYSAPRPLGSPNMTKFSNDFIVKFDTHECTIKIWLVCNGQQQEPPLLLPFAKARAGGLDVTSGFVGLKIVARSPAMRELFGLDIDPDSPLKDQIGSGGDLPE
jgi:hypothetical protein